MRTFSVLLIVAFVSVCVAGEPKPIAPSQTKEPTYDGKTLGDWITQAKAKGTLGVSQIQRRIRIDEHWP